MFARMLILAALAVLVWSVVARPSGAHGHEDRSDRVQALRHALDDRVERTTAAMYARPSGRSSREPSRGPGHPSGTGPRAVDGPARAAARARLRERRPAAAGCRPPGRGSLAGCELRSLPVDLDVVFLGTSGERSHRAAARRARCSSAAAATGCSSTAARARSGSCFAPRSASSTSHEIFLTHFHADHYLGLPGMLKTFALRVAGGAAHGLRPAGAPRAVRRRSAASSASSRTRSSSSRCAPAMRSSATATGCSSSPSQHGCAAVGYALVEDDAAGSLRRRGSRRARGPVRARSAARSSGARRSRSPTDARSPPRRCSGRRARGARSSTPATRHRRRVVAMLFHGADVLVHEATFAEEERDRAAETLHSTAAPGGRDRARRRRAGCSR